MFRGKHRSVAVLALLGVTATTLALLAPTAVAKPADSADDRLRQAQKAVLDPQAVNRPVDPDAVRAARRADLHRFHTARSTAPTGTGLPPRVGGRWDYLDPLASGFNAVHVVVGRGKILLVAGSGNDPSDFAAGTFRSFVCGAALSDCRAVDTPVDLFCAGHVLLPDGRALVGGGTISYQPFRGARYLYAFNFATEKYERLTPLEIGRWYPSMVTTANGQTLITGGWTKMG